MDLFKTIFIGFVLFLVYFNFVASLIMLLDEEHTMLVKCLRVVFIWLLPFLGFAMALRFSFQEHETALHTLLVPKIMHPWIYCEKSHKPNPHPQDYNGE